MNAAVTEESASGPVLVGPGARLKEVREAQGLDLSRAASLLHLSEDKLEALEEMKFPVTRAALVIGGGVAGIQAALDLADSGNMVYIVEREPSLGGVMPQLAKTYPTMDCPI